MIHQEVQTDRALDETTYYWEGRSLGRHGLFQAKTDEEAIQRVPSDCILLYKESDTADGTPFIVVLENKSSKVF